MAMPWTAVPASEPINPEAGVIARMMAMLMDKLRREPIVVGMPGMVSGPIFGQGFRAADYLTRAPRVLQTPAQPATLSPVDELALRLYGAQAGQSGGSVAPSAVLSNPLRLGEAQDLASGIVPGAAERSNLLGLLLRALRTQGVQ